MRAQISGVHEASFCGTRKVGHSLRREGVAIAHCTVERLRAAKGLTGVRQSKKAITTNADPKAPYQLDKINREFGVSRPSALWLVDFTHIRTWAAFVYAAFVLEALERAIHARRPGPDDGLIHHSDGAFNTLS